MEDLDLLLNKMVSCKSHRLEYPKCTLPQSPWVSSQVPRSNGERSNKALVAEEGKAKVVLLSSRRTGTLTWHRFRTGLTSLERQKAS